MSNRFDELLDSYYAGSLSVKEVAALEALLLADPMLRNQFRQAAALDTALRHVALKEAAPIASTDTPCVPASRTTRRHWIVAATCMLGLLVMGLALTSLLREPEIARLVQVTGTVEIHSASGSRPARVGARIRNRSELACAAGNTEVQFRLVDGSTFSAKSGARVRLLRTEGQFRLEVLEGIIDGEIMKQPEGKPLLIATADSTIKVLGTRLTIHRGADSTRLIVEEGRVEMTRKRDDEKVLVESDETAMVASRGDLAVADISALAVKRIEIVHARYGAGDHWVDVSQALRSRVANSRLIPVGDFNDLAGDPITNVVKALEVAFAINGLPGKKIYPEYIHTARRIKTTEVLLPLLGVPDFSDAQWIWHEGADEAAGTWYFRKQVELSAGRMPAKARILLTCDNIWTLQVNGTFAGQSIQAAYDEQGRPVWQRPGLLDLTALLTPGKNVITIAGTNFDHQHSSKVGAPSPAGLLVKLVLEFEDGVAPREWVSDRSWRSTADPGEAGRPVTVIGGHGMQPWGVLDASFR